MKRHGGDNALNYMHAESRRCAKYYEVGKPIRSYIKLTLKTNTRRFEI